MNVPLIASSLAAGGVVSSLGPRQEPQQKITYVALVAWTVHSDALPGGGPVEEREKDDGRSSFCGYHMWFCSALLGLTHGLGVLRHPATLTCRTPSPKLGVEGVFLFPAF